MKIRTELHTQVLALANRQIYKHILTQLPLKLIYENSQSLYFFFLHENNQFQCAYIICNSVNIIFIVGHITVIYIHK